jgi:hypothetical protein
MQRREVDAAQARQLLQGVEGQLRRLIDPA